MNEIIAQLVKIYYTYEDWHKTYLPPDKAIEYHKTRYKNGSIHTYEENGEVLGYYERYFNGDTCILYNAWIKEGYRKGKVFKELYRHFFKTMPDNINRIEGEKQKLGGKLMYTNLRRKYG